MIFNKMYPILLFFAFFSCSVFGQGGDENTWLTPRSKEIMNSMGIVVQTPQGFEFNKSFVRECFDGTLKLQNAFTCVNHKLVSDDNECVVFMPIRRVLTKEDSIRINSMFKGSIKSLNNFHNNQLMHQLKSLRGDQTTVNWKEAVTYYSDEEAKSKFNADTAIYYSIKLEDEPTYDGRYNNVYSLFIQKKDRFYINIIIFYSDKIKNVFDEKLVQIENMIRYED